MGRDTAGDATLCGDAADCVKRARATLPGIEVWPWITSPDGLKPDDEVALMKQLFAKPDKFTARAAEQVKSLALDGLNVDFEAPTEAPNLNKTFWMDTLTWADSFAKKSSVPVSLDAMCTANVSTASLCGNFGPKYNASATAAMVAQMKESRVQRFVSMGTYGVDQSMLLNEIDWFESQLHGKWGLGVCPTCIPSDSETNEQLRLRFGTAHAYGVLELDLFAFSSKYTAQWSTYWEYMQAFLECGTEREQGHCWPNDI